MKKGAGTTCLCCDLIPFYYPLYKHSLTVIHIMLFYAVASRSTSPSPRSPNNRSLSQTPPHAIYFPPLSLFRIVACFHQIPLIYFHFFLSNKNIFYLKRLKKEFVIVQSTVFVYNVIRQTAKAVNLYEEKAVFLCQYYRSRLFKKSIDFQKIICSFYWK